MYVTVNDARLYVDIEGSGLVADGPVMQERPTIVLVHGGPGADHTVYKPDYGVLSDIAQVVYYDHRGNGRSDLSSPEHWTLAQWADDLKGLCDALGIEKPIVVGASFGGYVAQAYAARHPGHAGKLALISTAACVDFEEVYRAFGRIGGPDTEAIARAYWDNPTDDTRTAYRDHCVPLYSVTPNPDTDWLTRMIIRNDTALHFNGPANEQGRMDFRGALSDVDCPVLVMCGDRDPIMPLPFSQEIAAGIPVPLLTQHVLPDCGHLVQVDQKDLVFEHLRAFILDA